MKAASVDVKTLQVNDRSLCLMRPVILSSWLQWTEWM